MGQAIDRVEKQFISASAGMGRVDPATTRRLQDKRDADVKVLRDSWQDWLEKERRNILGKVSPAMVDRTTLLRGGAEEGGFLSSGVFLGGFQLMIVTSNRFFC